LSLHRGQAIVAKELEARGQPFGIEPLCRGRIANGGVEPGEDNVSEFFAHDYFGIKVSPQMCSRHPGCQVVPICRLAVVSQVTIGWNELLGILQRLGLHPRPQNMAVAS
jgi:hypothetical protein